MSETRSSTESMNAPERRTSPRWRATEPSITSKTPPTISATPAHAHEPARISAPLTMFSASDSSVSCQGRMPVHSRNARIARYGHAKIRCAAPPAAPSLLRGAGMSRTRGASRGALSLVRGHAELAGERLEGDDPVAERAAGRLVGDLVARPPRPSAPSRTATSSSRSGRPAPSPRRARRAGTSRRPRRRSPAGVTVTSMPGPTASAASGASTMSGSRSICWILRIRDSIMPCSSLAASYSAFSLMSPCSRATWILSVMSARPSVVSSPELGLQPLVGVERQGRRGLLPGPTVGPGAQLFREFGHVPESTGRRRPSLRPR